MDLNDLLEKQGSQIVAEAADALARTMAPVYGNGDAEVIGERMGTLFQLVKESIETRNLVPIVEYAQSIARERAGEGRTLQEMQSAFNILEEVIWRKITSDLSPENYAEAFGMVSTVLGAAKEALALEFVSLATDRRIRSIDFGALFRYGQ